MKDHVGCFKVSRLRRAKCQTKANRQKAVEDDKEHLLSDSCKLSDIASRTSSQDISSLSDCSVSNSTSSSSSIESIRLDRIEFNEQCYKPILNQKGINVPPNETLTKSDAIPKAFQDIIDAIQHQHPTHRKTRHDCIS